MTDVLARIGATEFLVLAFNLDEVERVALAQRIHRQLAAPETTSLVGAEVRVSPGWVTRHPGDASSLEKLIGRSDWAMHEARKASRATGSPLCPPD